MYSMISKILYLPILLLLLPLLVACGSDESGLQEGRFCMRPMRFEGEVLGYGLQTRAQSLNFPEGAMLYLQVGNVMTTAVYEYGTWRLRLPVDFSDEESGTCTAYYFEQANTGQEEVELVGGLSVTYMGTGDYHNDLDMFTLRVTLRPLLPRVHFRGTPGTRIVVTGLKVYRAFRASTHAFTETAVTATLDVQADGYTPYVYAELTSDRLLTLSDGTFTYSRTFDETVMQRGESGFIDVPTPASCAGWTTDAKPVTDFDTTTDDYDGDEDWNQPDKEPTTDIDAGSTDYDDDEDWNQPDKDPTTDIDAGSTDYDDDEDWNQPDNH